MPSNVWKGGCHACYVSSLSPSEWNPFDREITRISSFTCYSFWQWFFFLTRVTSAVSENERKKKAGKRRGKLHGPSPPFIHIFFQHLLLPSLRPPNHSDPLILKSHIVWCNTSPSFSSFRTWSPFPSLSSPTFLLQTYTQCNNDLILRMHECVNVKILFSLSICSTRKKACPALKHLHLLFLPWDHWAETTAGQAKSFFQVHSREGDEMWVILRVCFTLLTDWLTDVFPAVFIIII